MSLRQRKWVGIVASIAGLAVMASVWVGAAPQSFALFSFGFVVAVGGAMFAGSAMKEARLPAAASGADQTLRLSGPALAAAIVGGLLMALCGGCVILWIVPDAGSSDFTNSAISVLVFGGFPFTIGLVIWLLAMASRKPLDGS